VASDGSTSSNSPSSRRYTASRWTTSWVAT